MNKEKQTEEMAMTQLDVLANDIYQHCPDLKENYCGDTHCVACMANALYNAGYRKHSGWISVNDRLPDKSGNYLVLTTNGNHAVLSYSAKHRLFNAFDGLSKKWNKMHTIPVAYWMMCPESPEI